MQLNFLTWHKTFGQAQNVLGPVEGRGISERVANGCSPRLFNPTKKIMVKCLTIKSNSNFL